MTTDQGAPAQAPPIAPGAVDRSHKGEPAPKVALAGVDGKPVTLAGFRGKPVLVNLWATWCAPCVAEMPTLDRAAGRIGPEVTVLAVNQGDEPAKVQGFLAGTPLTHARPLLDAKMAMSLQLAANLPTTILYDAGGRELWRVTGGRDWTSPASLKLLNEAG